MDKYTVIREAILKKQQVVATYRGHRREMCPHAIGTNREARAQALFYQFGGTSSSGLSTDPTEKWRCIPVDDLIDIEVRDGEWVTATNHSRPQSCVFDVDVEVSF